MRQQTHLINGAGASDGHKVIVQEREKDLREKSKWIKDIIVVTKAIKILEFKNLKF